LERSVQCFWRDGLGGRFEFEVFSPPYVRWNEVGGIYVMAKASVDGRTARAIYVGKTHDFSERLNDHEMWPRAQRLGATEIHAIVVRGPRARAELERALIRHLAPPLNTQLNIEARAVRIALVRRLQAEAR
jgi:excinuclease UvrABC nuclease subunit